MNLSIPAKPERHLHLGSIQYNKPKAYSVSSLPHQSSVYLTQITLLLWPVPCIPGPAPSPLPHLVLWSYPSSVGFITAERTAVIIPQRTVWIAAFSPSISCWWDQSIGHILHTAATGDGLPEGTQEEGRSGEKAKVVSLSSCYLWFPQNVGNTPPNFQRYLQYIFVTDWL